MVLNIQKPFSYADEFERTLARNRRNDAPRQQIEQLSDQQESYNIQAYEGKGIEKLAEFSWKLANVLRDQKVKKNEEDRLDYLNKWYTDGGYRKLIDEHKVDLKRIREDKEYFKKVEADLKAKGVDTLTLYDIRDASDHQILGLAQGVAKEKGNQYNLWLRTQMMDNDTTKIPYAGGFITPKGATGREQKKYAMAYLRSEYLRESGIANFNPALLEEQAFKTMRAADTKLFNEFYADELEKRTNESINTSYRDFTTSKDLPTLLEELSNTIDLKKGGDLGLAGAWDHLEKHLPYYVISGQVTMQDLEKGIETIKEKTGFDKSDRLWKIKLAVAEGVRADYSADKAEHEVNWKRTEDELAEDITANTARWRGPEGEKLYKESQIALRSMPYGKESEKLEKLFNLLGTGAEYKAKDKERLEALFLSGDLTLDHVDNAHIDLYKEYSEKAKRLGSLQRSANFKNIKNHAEGLVKGRNEWAHDRDLTGDALSISTELTGKIKTLAVRLYNSSRRPGQTPLSARDAVLQAQDYIENKEWIPSEDNDKSLYYFERSSNVEGGLGKFTNWRTSRLSESGNTVLNILKQEDAIDATYVALGSKDALLNQAGSLITESEARAYVNKRNHPGAIVKYPPGIVHGARLGAKKVTQYEALKTQIEAINTKNKDKEGYVPIEVPPETVSHQALREGSPPEYKKLLCDITASEHVCNRYFSSVAKDLDDTFKLLPGGEESADKLNKALEEAEIPEVYKSIAGALFMFSVENYDDPNIYTDIANSLKSYKTDVIDRADLTVLSKQFGIPIKALGYGAARFGYPFWDNPSSLRNGRN